MGNIRNLSITGIFKVWIIHHVKFLILCGKVGQRQARAALLNVDSRPAQSKPVRRFWTSGRLLGSWPERGSGKFRFTAILGERSPTRTWGLSPDLRYIFVTDMLRRLQNAAF